MFLSKLLASYNQNRKSVVILKTKRIWTVTKIIEGNFYEDWVFTLGGTLTASSLISANIIDTDKNMHISPEQKAFMNSYEKWMDEFIKVIRIQKVDTENIENNKNIVLLSERSKKWQFKLHEYMTDDNFARYFMKATERMTLEI